LKPHQPDSVIAIIYGVNVGQALREARTRAALSQREFARVTGVAQPTIARIEGGREDPRVKTLDRLLRACGSTLTALTASGAPDARAILALAKVVGLVDWKGVEVPASLVRAGLDVFSLNVARHQHSGMRYSWCPPGQAPPGGEGVTLFAGDGQGQGQLVGVPLATWPTRADLLCVYRPAEEQPKLARLAIDLGATAFWVEDGATLSAEARAIAEGAGLAFIAGVSVAEVAARLR